MKKVRRSLLWMLVLALPASLLLLLPLRAQEKKAEAPPEPEPARAEELPPDERVSADNNLSFPVDI
jgi:hypothetical protein